MMQVQNHRLRPLLRSLYEHWEYITSLSLAKKLGVSDRTIRSDIKELSFMLRGKGADILSKPSRGYRMQVTNRQNFLHFYHEFINGYHSMHVVPTESADRVAFIIAQILKNTLTGRIVLQEDLADELFISLSTLKKYLHEIKKSLARFKLELRANRTQGVHVVGDEAQIRYAIAEYVFQHEELLDVMHNPFFAALFSSEEVTHLREILLAVIEQHEIHLTDIAFKNLLMHLLIALSRRESNHAVMYSVEELARLEKTPYFEVVLDLLQRIKKATGKDLQDESHYLTQLFIASRRYTESTQAKEQVRPLVQKILTCIHERTGVDLRDDKEFISHLSVHLLAAVNRLKFHMNIRNTLLNFIKEKFPLAFDMALIASEILEKEEHIQSNENETGFLAIHFGAALERSRYDQAYGKRAIIVCGAGLSSAVMLKTSLARKFGPLLKIEKILSSRELKPCDIASTDFIFTTVPLPKIPRKKVIEIPTILTEQDFHNIETHMHCVGQSMYRQFFKEALFFPYLQAKNAKEVLRELCRQMMSQGFIDQRTRTSIYKRERLSPTELAGCIAVPHAIRNFMSRPAIAVAVLQKPIRWHRLFVRVVFLLSIPQKFIRLLETTVQGIYYAFVSRDGARRIEKDRTFATLMQILEENPPPREVVHC